MVIWLIPIRKIVLIHHKYSYCIKFNYNFHSNKLLKVKNFVKPSAQNSRTEWPNAFHAQLNAIVTTTKTEFNLAFDMKYNYEKKWTLMLTSSPQDWYLSLKGLRPVAGQNNKEAKYNPNVILTKIPHFPPLTPQRSNLFKPPISRSQLQLFVSTKQLHR